MLLLTPRDLLIPAGAEAALEIEVEHALAPFLDPSASGVDVDLDGIGRANSGADGVARIPLGRLPEGSHRLRAKAHGVEVDVLVRVIPKERPLLITDIDHTIADVSSVGFIFRPTRGVLAIPGARETLTVLASRMELVYLTARDHRFRAKTLDWLRGNGFPEAPVYLRRGSRFWTCSSRRHKTACLAELRGGFPSIVVGIGDTRGDLLAYRAHGIPAIQIGPRALGGLPDGAVWARDWKEIEGRLRGS